MLATFGSEIQPVEFYIVNKKQDRKTEKNETLIFICLAKKETGLDY
jgi:hypothetical protein